MIRAGDCILLGVSGGKDSLSLLAVLRHLRTYAPVRFELGVVTVDPQVPGFDPSPLGDYYDRLGVTWFYERRPILEQARQRMDGDSFCAYCARMKRGIITAPAAARATKYWPWPSIWMTWPRTCCCPSRLPATSYQSPASGFQLEAPREPVG